MPFQNLLPLLLGSYAEAHSEQPGRDGHTTRQETKQLQVKTNPKVTRIQSLLVPAEGSKNCGTNQVDERNEEMRS